jgi:hypothetical protein
MGQLPRHTSSLRIEREANSPHYTCSIAVCETTALANNLHRHAESGSNGFYVVVKVKVFIPATVEARLPSVGQVDEQDVEKGAPRGELLYCPGNGCSKNNVWRLANFEVTL